MPNSRYRELYWYLVVVCMLCFVMFELFDEELEGKAEGERYYYNQNFLKHCAKLR